MKCTDPTFGHACSKCDACRLNKRRMWVHRLLLEAYDHKAAYFITLTYRDPPADGKVNKRDAQLFLKRLRKVAELPVRYYLVGEYGDRFGRPHYHAIIYGGAVDALRFAELLELAWPLGFVQVGSLSAKSAAYVLKYVTKRKKEGEFALMSRKPGLGNGAVIRAAAAFYRRGAGKMHLATALDVASGLRTDGKVQPLGRYLKRALRVYSGLDAAQPPDAARAQALAARFAPARSLVQERRIAAQRIKT